MDAEIKIKNKLSVLNTLLDDRCDLYGIKNTIAYLLDQGLTKEEILDLHFDEDDVEYVLENPDEDYDCE